MRQQVVVTLSSNLTTSGTVTLPHRVDPFWFAEADHVAVYGSVRYKSPTDFTLACDGNGEITLTWLSATTIPSGAQLNVGVARVDMITTATGVGGGGGGGTGDASEATLQSVASSVDGLEALITALNTKIDTLNTTAADTTPVGVYASGLEYETVAASQTAQVIGPTGGVGDVLVGVLVIPATVNPGAVTILDDATAITVFAGGTASVSNYVPFFVPLNMASVNGAWKITTGANVSAIAVGNFT